MPTHDDPTDRPRANTDPPDPLPPEAGATPPENTGGADEEDFARMLEESLVPKTYQEGETVSGTIVAVGPDVAFVDVGGKGEATIALEELVDPDSDIKVKVGDPVQAIVVSTVGGLKLSHKLARGAATRQLLEDAYRSGLPVEGRVEKAIKGGFEIRLAGERAFCPISQIDTGFTDDPGAHVGQVYTFHIMEYREAGKNLVVSRRSLLEEADKERAAEVRQAAVPDAVLTGRVVSVRPYGAFVDLGGGVQGLLHVSEMGWSRVADPAHLVQVGDEVTVMVLRVDKETGKIALGLKQLQADPWSNLEDRYRVGQVLKGTITRVAEFGAFVELEPGIEALAHVSSFAPTGKRDGWKEAAVSGGTVAIEILSIEPGRKRIGVAILEEGSARAGRAGAAATGESGSAPGGAGAEITPGARLTGRVERHERYGIFVFLAPGRTGLIHSEEIGADKGGDPGKLFPVGSDIEVIVLDVDPDGRRIGLSRKAVLEAGEKQAVSDYTAKQDKEQSEGFGSLADKLRAAMRPKGK